MKEKRFCIGDRAAVLLGLCLLLGMGLFALLWPHPEFIDAERRYRASAPSVPSLTDWKTDRETEAFLADRVPLRNVLVAADSLAEVATARRTELDAWHKDSRRPVSSEFVFMNWTPSRIVLRDRWETDGFTNYWRYGK